VAYASEAQDAAENKAMGILAYIIFLIPLLAAPKQSRFARYHTNQGLVLFLLGLAYGLVWTVLTGILGAAVLTGGFALWSIVALVMSLLWLVYPVLAIVGIVNAAQGRMKPLPVIGGISILK
jgi:uncharacterized membrane protein